ncbi:MAG: manganese/zinc/iron transport system substrate-binding protein [Rhodobacteraceae bacterium HLUCCA12]|nr:MAG: manganese/zinc/iron transport system substrate-binding protein [Rhodobacteraceae bacterium HLUCCA12]
MRVRFMALLASLALVPAMAAAESPRLLATIGMIADPAARMAGDCVQVETLVGPGLDPHVYQPRPSDIERLRAADRVVALGLGLEGRLGDVLARTGAVILGDAVDPDALLQADGSPDPHIWMDPTLWSAVLPGLADTLIELAPDCADRITARRADEEARFAALDAWAEDSLHSIPEAQRVLLTAHDAFAYFARRYEVETLAIQGISTESEPSIAVIDSLAREAAERAIPAAFIETTLNPRAVRALIEATQSRGHDLAQGGALYSDALGEPGSGADSYLGMIVSNVTTITEALGGTPAALPEALDLD